jgi:hypothetical protein
MNKPASQLNDQSYPELQLVEVERPKTRKERLMEAYKRLSDGLDVVIERHKQTSE